MWKHLNNSGSIKFQRLQLAPCPVSITGLGAAVIIVSLDYKIQGEAYQYLISVSMVCLSTWNWRSHSQFARSSCFKLQFLLVLYYWKLTLHLHLILQKEDLIPHWRSGKRDWICAAYLSLMAAWLCLATDALLTWCERLLRKPKVIKSTPCTCTIWIFCLCKHCTVSENDKQKINVNGKLRSFSESMVMNVELAQWCVEIKWCKSTTVLLSYQPDTPEWRWRGTSAIFVSSTCAYKNCTCVCIHILYVRVHTCTVSYYAVTAIYVLTHCKACLRCS